MSVAPVNRLIAGLPRKDRLRIVDRCEPMDLVPDAVLCEPDRPLRHVYFPQNGFISMVATVRAHPPLEMGLIGNEGMLGATLVLDVESAPLRGVVRGPGVALRMSARTFRKELDDCVALKRSVRHYLYVLMAQLTQTAVCTRFHPVEARLARWLLMTHDRADADQFHLTHERLADMIGVRRSGVTIAAGVLSARRLIRYSRGEIQILDRGGLEKASCECYGAVIEDYARLLGQH